MRLRNISYLLSMAIMAALVALPGCAGGGGGGSRVGERHIGGNPGITLHTMRVGDQWKYTFGGVVTSQGQNGSSVTGTLTRTIVAKSLNGANMAIEEVSAYSFSGGGLDGGGGGETTDTYFTQDQQGNIFETGQVSTPVGGATTTLTTTSVGANNIVIPGNWAAGQTTNAHITYSDNSNLTSQFEIGNQQSITTTAGVFTGWQVEVLTNGVNQSFQNWDPKMGSYLTNTYSQNMDVGGLTWTLTPEISLTSSTVPG